MKSGVANPCSLLSMVRVRVRVRHLNEGERVRVRHLSEGERVRVRHLSEGEMVRVRHLSEGENEAFE